MAEKLVLPLLRGVIGKAGDVLVQSITRMWGVDGDRRKLERHLMYVSSKLADAELKSETDPAVKLWMKALKAVTYKADDVLDNFQYEALRREAQGNQSITSKVLDNFTSNNRLVFCYKTSRDLKDVLCKIDELMAEMSKFGLVERAEIVPIPYRQTHSAMDDSAEIFGRDVDKEAVVQQLLNHQDQQNVQVLSIIGMGGLGKTTLAKMVYNDSRVQKHFVLKMWHCVSENFEAIPLVRSVIEVATNDKCHLPDNLELLRGKLQEVIGRKRFLLVLDDVWNEQQHKWEDDLKPLLCSVGGSGSMILVTCRSRGVASIMCTFPPYELACLSEDDSWELFSKKAFSKGVKEQPELVLIGRRIVNKCKRLPLALKTVGGLMSSKQELQEWEAIADCNISDTSRGKDEVMSILKLSYKHLSSEMKQCFAFCAVFPKDCEMEKDMLIQLWMANGYIHEEGMMDMVQKAELVFKELVWRSFLQDFILESRTFQIGPQKDTRTIELKQEFYGCKMHDLMHDLAKGVANECATVEELIQRKVSINDVFHLQIPEYHPLNKITPLFKGTKNLRTLLTPSSSEKDLEKTKLRSSRVLCFKCCDFSVAHRKLIQPQHLRYLDLSGSHIISLPETLSMFYNLLSLRLNCCYQLESLPEHMRFMMKLRYIYLLGCNRLKRMPLKLGLLRNLRTLTTFVVDTEDGRGIEELENLRQLDNRLELYNLWKVKCGSKVNLHDKRNLNQLLLCWGQSTMDRRVYKSTAQEQVLESLMPHDELEILIIFGYSGSTFSPWMRKFHMFKCLRKLTIHHCYNCEDLPAVWLLPSLEHLSLCNIRLTTLCKNMDIEDKSCNTPAVIFPKLKYMRLDDLFRLDRWTENSAGEANNMVLFPELKALSIYNCNKLTTLPVSPVLTNLQLSYSGVGMGMHLDGLPTLSLSGDDTLVSIFKDSGLQFCLRDRLAFVETLDISSCSNTVHWPLEELRCLPRLLSLWLSYFSKLEGMSSSSEEEEILPLPLLKSLQISDCASLLEIPLLPPSLEEVEISHCKSLVVLPSILPLPLLKSLQIRGCASLLEIPLLPPSLEEVEISHCKSLVVLPSNFGNLAKLRGLRVHSCDALKALAEGMDGLSSLELLTIECCPGIEEFPQGLLQLLPNLNHLVLFVSGCPDLQTRCREGGEYFELVASIPLRCTRCTAETRRRPYFIGAFDSPCGIHTE